MNKIRKLSHDEIRKIAAGEVVERPANLVKELVENSLDAGASEVSIYIEEGGKKLVRVIDNGFGMSFDDVKASFEQHATSKIVHVDDLQTLHTFGFRGEALSSIASISKVIITTKEVNAESGINLHLSYGAVEKEVEVATADGTDITIYEIFSNIPARKKFLKATDTEWRQIILLFQSFVLAHHAIHFKLFHDGRLVHNCPSVADRKLRVLQLWDQRIVDRLITLDFSDSVIGFSCCGYISDHQYARYNTAQVFLFVNGRWIKNQKLIKALLRGYQNVHQHGRYPAAFLFIETDAALIDVNIHPRKEEVQFVHAHKIEQLLQRAVSKKLDENVSVQLRSESHVSSQVSSFFSSPSEFFASGTTSSSVAPRFPFDIRTNVSSQKSYSPSSVISSAPVPTQEGYREEQIAVETPLYRLVGQVHRTYIILEKDDGLVVIDQHAAHERILYEEFRKRFEQVETIKLMFPYTVLVDEEELSLLKEYEKMLVQYGIVGDQMGVDRFVVKAVPVYLKNTNLGELVKEVITIIRENETLDEELFGKKVRERIHAQMACKAAVKAGDELSFEKMHEIVSRLEKTENRLTCPHGRPTIWFLSLSDIEKRFRRDYIK